MITPGIADPFKEHIENYDYCEYSVVCAQGVTVLTVFNHNREVKQVVVYDTQSGCTRLSVHQVTLRQDNRVLDVLLSSKAFDDRSLAHFFGLSISAMNRKRGAHNYPFKQGALR